MASAASTAFAATAIPGRALATTSTPVLQTLTLAGGQEALYWLDRGAVLHVHHGSLTLEEAPRFWAALAWRQASLLPRGQVWVAPRAGWVRLTAGPGRCEFSARLPAGRHCPPPPRC